MTLPPFFPTEDPSLTRIHPAIRAAISVAAEHGVPCDRCEILQDGNTLVLRLSESLVARIVVDREGPRQGTDWFERENAVALHLAHSGAPVIPLHPNLPPGPYHSDGFAMNFWQFVTRIDATPDPAEVATTLHQCHSALRSFTGPLPKLGILQESLDLLEILRQRALFPEDTLGILHHHLASSLSSLAPRPAQPLHGDAHPGNLMNTTLGLLWTDWEDTFLGPPEWDLASVIWNTRIIDQDHATADLILASYQKAGGHIDAATLDQCLIARAAVMTAWYPILYPEPSPERSEKLAFRVDWLRAHR